MTFQFTITEDFSPSLVLSLMSSVVGSVVDMKMVMKHEQAGDMGYGWLKTKFGGLRCLCVAKLECQCKCCA